MKDYKTGDKVKLISGSAPMTVKEVLAINGIVCMYYNGETGLIDEKTIPADCLVLYDD